MGLLDGLLGNVLGNGVAAQLIEGFIQQHGGIAGVVQQLEASGLGAQAQSWVSKGTNLPVSAEQIGQAFGNSPVVQKLTQQFGIDPQVVFGHLAQLLPGAIDQATPNGSLPGR